MVGLYVMVIHSCTQQTDGGANWELQNSGTTNKLYRVFAISSAVYVTGWSGTLLKYTGEE